MNVLLVEDNLINQKLMVRILEKAGHRVIVACNGKEGIETFLANIFDLVLMDIQMPGMDGVKVTETIRMHEAVRDVITPIIAVTAHCLHGERQRCFRAGMNGFMTKPVRQREFFAEIARVLKAA